MSYYTILYMRQNARTHFAPSSRLKRGVKDLPVDARPREKLLAKGSENLSDEDILAILLGTGSAKRNVLKVSQSLLKDFPVRKLADISFSKLSGVSGVGKVKALRIMAALELGRRVFVPLSLTSVTIRSAQDAISQVRDIIDRKQEYLVVLYLNARHELIQKEVIGKGSLNNMLITPREVFAPALTAPCASIIIIHNHPSGDPTPSDADIKFTAQIQAAGVLMGVSMLDHLIVTSRGYFSFGDNKVSR